jgi:hypothetical protein
MLDKLITYIVWWYKTVYQVLPVAWTNRITTRSENWFIVTKGLTYEARSDVQQHDTKLKHLNNKYPLHT